MNRLQLEKTFAAMDHAHVLVVGDLILDKYTWGSVGRISPEAPVQVVEVESEEIRLGGAGNVVNNLLSLGCRVSLVSIVGNDPDGCELLSLLQHRDLDVSGSGK